jgi:hypothetical protein
MPRKLEQLQISGANSFQTGSELSCRRIGSRSLTIFSGFNMIVFNMIAAMNTSYS